MTCFPGPSFLHLDVFFSTFYPWSQIVEVLSFSDVFSRETLNVSRLHVFSHILWFWLNHVQTKVAWHSFNCCHQICCLLSTVCHECNVVHKFKVTNLVSFYPLALSWIYGKAVFRMAFYGLFSYSSLQWWWTDRELAYPLVGLLLVCQNCWSFHQVLLPRPLYWYTTVLWYQLSLWGCHRPEGFSWGCPLWTLSKAFWKSMNIITVRSCLGSHAFKYSLECENVIVHRMSFLETILPSATFDFLHVQLFQWLEDYLLAPLE